MHGLHRLMLLVLVGLLLALPLAVAAQAVSGGTIEYGETVSAELTEDEPALEYTFTGSESDSVVITLISEDFDTYLTLLDEDGDELTYDDDSAGSLDSRIGPFSLPADGEYTIVAQSYAFRNGSGEATGEFDLTLDTFATDVIEFGETVDGALTTGAMQAYYSFSGSEGDSVIIRLSSDDFDSYLTLSDPDGNQLITNDDGGGNLNALIGPFPLPDGGDYLIAAGSYSGGATGDYTLSLERAELQTLDYGDTVTVEFDENNTIAYFTFEGSYSDIVDVEVDGDVDTNLTLNDPYSYQVAFDEDGGSGKNPELTGVLLNSEGTYTLLLQSPFGGSGSVELTLMRSEVPSLNDGPQSLTFSSSQSTRTLGYTGEEGETIRINVSVSGADTASPTLDITQDGSSLSYISASNVESLSAIFTIPDDGDLVITISEYSYDNLSLEVSVSSAE